MMSDHWPAGAGATAEFRARCDAEHWTTRRAAAPVQVPEDHRLAALERRLTGIERTLGPGGQALINGIIPALGEVVAEIKRDVNGLLVAVHRRDQTAVNTMVKDLVTKELEAFGACRFAGVWRGPVDYRPNELVSHGGSLWLSLISSRAVRPGSAPIAWRMVTKSGQAV